MYSDKAKSFAKFPALGERFIAVDEYNSFQVSYYAKTHYFQATFFVPRRIQKAVRWIYKFFSVNGTHTSSKFQITLLVAVSIDANDETLPLA
jgi:hypothetical protein